MLLLGCVFVTMFVASRFWVRRQPQTAQARYRVLGIGLWLLGLAIIGLAFTRQETQSWGGLALLTMAFYLAVRERSRLRREIRLGHHDASLH
jgi:hypothetical protein